MSTTKMPTEPVRQTVRRRLASSGFNDLRSVSVNAQGGKLRIGGCVRTYYMKQMAGAIAMAVPGVVLLDNAIEVK